VSTIHDVAKHSGVSTATVSRVLNGNPKVDLEMRRRVLESVEALRYIPNGSARSLVTKQTRQVALVISDITNPFFAEAARGAQDALDEHGYQLLLANSDDNQARELRSLRTFATTGVDGLLIAPAMPAGQGTAAHRSAQRQLARELEHFKIPVVGFSPEPVAPHADLVAIDEVSAAFKAVDHLFGLGHVRVALINGPEHSGVGHLRGLGYAKALKHHGLALDPSLVIPANFRREGGYEAMKSLLALVQPPTAVFAADDLIAIGAMRAIKEAGRRIPDDVALVCIGNTSEASEVDPPLSAIAVPRGYEFGRIGAQLLLEHLAQTSASQWVPRHITLDTRLIVRASTVAGLMPVA
jgi:LacI family transcriptional regulator